MGPSPLGGGAGGGFPQFPALSAEKFWIRKLTPKSSTLRRWVPSPRAYYGRGRRPAKIFGPLQLVCRPRLPPPVPRAGGSCAASRACWPVPWRFWGRGAPSSDAAALHFSGLRWRVQRVCASPDPQKPVVGATTTTTTLVSSFPVNAFLRPHGTSAPINRSPLTLSTRSGCLAGEGGGSRPRIFAQDHPPAPTYDMFFNKICQTSS